MVISDGEDGKRHAWWGRIKHCNRHWVCPTCCEKTSAKRADELDRLMRGDPGGRWQMLTLTLRHHAGEGLAAVIDRLMHAWRHVRAHRRVRRIMSARVTASVRALEITWGSSGWHPHIHLLWRTSEWTQAERDELESLWCTTAGAVVGVGVRWSSTIENWQRERAGYIAKLGAEVAGLGKDAHGGHLTPWQIATNAADYKNAAHDSRWFLLWQEFQLCTKGRRRIEFDERAKAMVLPPDPKPLSVRVDCYAELYTAAMSRDWWLALSVLETACFAGGSLEDAARAVEAQLEVIAAELRIPRGPPGDARLDSGGA